MANVTLRVTVDVPELCLQALLWNYLAPMVTDEAEAYYLVTALGDKRTKEVIRNQIKQWGIGSVECGPSSDYPSQRVEQAVRLRVRNTFMN